MKKILSFLLLGVIALSGPACAKVRVVTATQDLADITKSVGGSKVDEVSLSRGTQDPHRVEPRPSQVVTLARADLLVRIGMDLDTWVDGLINAARNSDLFKDGKGYVDASAGIRKLDVPSGRVDASMGDIHIYGNPHYWLDPQNGIVIARNVLNGLKRVDSRNSDYYEDNYKQFVREVKDREEKWEKELAPYRGTSLVTYHRTWPYFFRRFSFKAYDEIESKPGIPPSPSHIASLSSRMKREHIHVILVEHFYSRKFADLVAKQADAKVVVVPVSTGGERGSDSYLEMLNTVVSRLASALRETR